MTEPKRRYRTGYLTEKRAARRQLLKDHLGGACVTCGTTEDLQFNHKNPEEKRFTISEIIHKNIDFVLKEVEKCELLCKECHKKETRRQFRDGELTVWNAGTRKPYVHGTCRMYKQQSCRCDLCCLADHLYMKHKAIGFQDVVDSSWLQIFDRENKRLHCRSEQAQRMLDYLHQQ